MVVKTFTARVAGGQLHYQEPLDELEGEQVQVTVIGKIASAPVSNGSDGTPDEAPEPPEWLDVEMDVYVKMPLQSEILKDVLIVEGEPLRPCLIFPEELPDD